MPVRRDQHFFHAARQRMEEQPLLSAQTCCPSPCQSFQSKLKEPACLAFVPTGVHAQRLWLLKSSKIRGYFKIRLVGSSAGKLVAQQKGLATGSPAIWRRSSGHLGASRCCVKASWRSFGKGLQRSRKHSSLLEGKPMRWQSGSSWKGPAKVTCQVFMLEEAHVEHLIHDHLQTVLNISKNVEYSSFLGNLCQYVINIIVHKYFLMLRRNLPWMFVSSSLSPVTECHWKQPFPLAFTLSLQISVHLEDIYPWPPLPQAEESELSPPFSYRRHSSSFVI